MKLEEILDIIDAAMIKRRSEGKDYGTAVVTEGIADLMNAKDLQYYFGGSPDKAHTYLGHVLVEQLEKRWSKRNYDMYIRHKVLGMELRAADPNAHDIILGRELGFAAMMSCKERQINAVIVTMRGGELVSIPLSEMVDPETHDITVKAVNIDSLSFKVAQSYMIKLKKSDLRDESKLKLYAAIANCDIQTFLDNFTYVAV